MDLIDEALESTSTFEAPKRFYYWSMLSAISAVLKDRVYFDMAGNYKVYPNIYVLLYGPSGIRKGPAINLAEDLVSRVDNTRVIDGRSSIEAVISELGTARTREGKPMIKDACGFMVASELSSSIIGNNSAMDIMTNLYDRLYNEKEWKYRLKVGASASLMKPTITWLAGTNEALFRDFLPEKNLHGGLIGRMFVISEVRKQNTNSLMFKTKTPDRERLANLLKHVAEMKGDFGMTDTTRHAIDKWYVEFDKNVGPQLKDQTGFVSRILDFIIKISMLLAAGRRQEQIIRMEDVTEATSVVLPLVAPTKKIASSLKVNDISAVAKRGMVITYLAHQEGCKEERTKLLQNLGLHIDHEDLDKIAQDMIQRNTLVIEQHGGTITYRLKTERPEIAQWIKENYQ